VVVNVKNSKQFLARSIRLHRRWIDETSQNILARATKCLETDLADGSIRSMRNVSDAVRSLAIYYGAVGVVAHIDRAPSASEMIHKSCHYHFWNVCIDALTFRRLGDSPGLTESSPRVACLLCHAIVGEVEPRIQVLAELLADMASEPQMVDRGFWQERCFEPFVLRLHEILTTQPPAALKDGEDFGVYSAILANWNNDGPLAAALVKACDYHCQNMDDDGGDWKPEFSDPPFDLIPCEILAIQKVRRRLGLSTPTIDHPLMAANMTDVRPPANISDDILQRVASLYQSHATVT
jgi:hypothetical protein